MLIFPKADLIPCHIIEKGCLRPDPSLYQNLMDFPLPVTIAELNRIIGLFAYYVKWIKDCFFS